MKNIARKLGRSRFNTSGNLVLAVATTLLTAQQMVAQKPQVAPQGAESQEARMRRLSTAIELIKAQAAVYQQQLADLQKQLADIQRQLATPGESASAITDHPNAQGSDVGSRDTAVSGSQTSSLEELREQEAMQGAQIATHEESKVETESKYPLKLSGLVLFNAFVNTGGTDLPADPTYATPAAGSTGLSLRQTVLGLDARGPHVFGATSHADMRIDFSGGSNSPNGYGFGGLIRLRTAHADLTWRHTELFVELDRPLLSPNTPSSLLAVAQPELAWSGNLWTWNPQVGLTQTWKVRDTSRLTFQAALIDVADPQLPSAAESTSNVSLTERSRWLGTETRVAWARGEPGVGPEIGIGGYFSPHKTSDGDRFDAWAGSLDARLPLGRHFEWTASAYRGVALGGLGGGGYLDYFYQYAGITKRVRPLDDIGGWTQLKAKPTQRLEINAGFGMDNPFAREIYYAPPPPGYVGYTGLARNRSVYANVIYSPSSYLLFSLEYRKLWSNYFSGPPHLNDAIGLGAGYRF